MTQINLDEEFLLVTQSFFFLLLLSRRASAYFFPCLNVYVCVLGNIFSVFFSSVLLSSHLLCVLEHIIFIFFFFQIKYPNTIKYASSSNWKTESCRCIGSKRVKDYLFFSTSDIYRFNKILF